MELETPSSPALDKFSIIAFSFTLALERGLVMAACKQRVAAFLLSKLWLENCAATHTDTHVLCVVTHAYVYTLHTSWSYLEPFFLSYLRMFFVSVTNLQSQFYREYLNRNRHSNSSVSYVIGHHAELLIQKITSTSIHKKRQKNLVTWTPLNIIHFMKFVRTPLSWKSLNSLKCKTLWIKASSESHMQFICCNNLCGIYQNAKHIASWPRNLETKDNRILIVQFFSKVSLKLKDHEDLPLFLSYILYILFSSYCLSYFLFYLVLWVWLLLRSIVHLCLIVFSLCVCKQCPLVPLPHQIYLHFLWLTLSVLLVVALVCSFWFSLPNQCDLQRYEPFIF